MRVGVALLVAGAVVAAGCGGGGTGGTQGGVGKLVNPGGGAGGGGGAPGGGGGAGGGGGGCWVGNWLSQQWSITLHAPNGVVAPLSGGANVHVSLQTNGVMQQDFSHSGALNGFETIPGSGVQTAVSAQYSGTELDQITVSGDTSGTMTIKVESGAPFTLVSGDRTTQQVDPAGAVGDYTFTCSGDNLDIRAPDSDETYLRVNF